MTTGYIGILKQREMFRTYYRDGEKGSWKRILLDAEEESFWSDHSFDEIFRYLQIDTSTSSLGIFVISDKEELIDFPKVSVAVSLSYQDIRDFCWKYVKKGAACWTWNGLTLDEEICQKIGVPINADGENQYILTNAEPKDNTNHLLSSQSMISEEKFEEKKVVFAESEKRKMKGKSKTTKTAKTAKTARISLTEKQRRHEEYFNDIYNGDRPNPLKK